MSSKISERELKSPVGAIYHDFNGDEAVRADRYSVRWRCSHGRRTASGDQFAVSISLEAVDNGFSRLKQTESSSRELMYGKVGAMMKMELESVRWG